MKLVEPRSAINVTKLSPASLEKLRKAIINKKIRKTKDDRTTSEENKTILRAKITVEY